MPRGSRPGERRGGRKKGTPNKRSAAAADRLAASGLLPHEFLAAVAQGQQIDGHKPTFDERMKAAADAAPYYAARLTAGSLHHSGEIATGAIDAPPRAETNEEWIARRQRELAALGTAAGASASRH